MLEPDPRHQPIRTYTFRVAESGLQDVCGVRAPPALALGRAAEGERGAASLRQHGPHLGTAARPPAADSPCSQPEPGSPLRRLPPHLPGPAMTAKPDGIHTCASVLSLSGVCCHTLCSRLCHASMQQAVPQYWHALLTMM